MAWAWRHTTAMDWFHPRRQKNYYSHTYRRKTGGFYGHMLSLKGYFITPKL